MSSKSFGQHLNNMIEDDDMSTKKLTKAQDNDKFMADMRAKGHETIFALELPHPESTRNCQLILARAGNLIHIREEV